MRYLNIMVTFLANADFYCLLLLLDLSNLLKNHDFVQCQVSSLGHFFVLGLLWFLLAKYGSPCQSVGLCYRVGKMEIKLIHLRQKNIAHTAVCHCLPGLPGLSRPRILAITCTRQTRICTSTRSAHFKIALGCNNKCFGADLFIYRQQFFYSAQAFPVWIIFAVKFGA